jgi:hypothetical protein
MNRTFALQGTINVQGLNRKRKSVPGRQTELFVRQAAEPFRNAKNAVATDLAQFLPPGCD